MHTVHRWNIEGNGRIVIDKGGNKIFFPLGPHYNDTCKDNDAFTGGFDMVRLKILNMKGFLDTINDCTGKVYMFGPDGKKVQIGKDKWIQSSLWQQYCQNKNCLRLALEIPEPKDYMSIVSYYAGDC